MLAAAPTSTSSKWWGPAALCQTSQRRRWRHLEGKKNPSLLSNLAGQNKPRVQGWGGIAPCVSSRLLDGRSGRGPGPLGDLGRIAWPRDSRSHRETPHTVQGLGRRRPVRLLPAAGRAFGRGSGPHGGRRRREASSRALREGRRPARHLACGRRGCVPRLPAPGLSLRPGRAGAWPREGAPGPVAGVRPRPAPPRGRWEHLPWIDPPRPAGGRCPGRPVPGEAPRRPPFWEASPRRGSQGPGPAGWRPPFWESWPRRGTQAPGRATRRLAASPGRSLPRAQPGAGSPGTGSVNRPASALSTIGRALL